MPPKPELFFHATFPEGGPPRAVVGILHGYADHGARYAHVADAWAERSIASIALDLRGHGRSEGRRGLCESFGEYLDDVAELRALLTRRAPGIPMFLFGHSFGALVGLASLLASPSPWRGGIFGSPYLGIALKVPAVKRVAGQLASRVWPAFSLPTGFRGADLTHDAARAQGYDDDPLVFKEATARWYTEAVAAQARVLAAARSFTIPMYVFAGTEDRLADLSATRQFVAALKSADQTFDVHEGAFHEVLNEPDWRATADRVADWILARAS